MNNRQGSGAPSPAMQWRASGPYLLSLLRIAAGVMFTLAGTMKVMAFPAGVPPDGARCRCSPRSVSADSLR